MSTAPTRAGWATYASPRGETFLEERGLARSAATTRLVHSQDGVNCLGLHLRTCGTQGTWLPVPQQEKVLTHLRARRSSWDAPTQPPAGHVMKALHPVIRGWAPSSRHGAAQPVCQKARHAQWQLLWAWAKRRPPHQSSQWVKARDCRSAGSWTCWAGQAAWVQPDATPMTRFTKVKGRRSPYDPALRQYGTERQKPQVGRDTDAQQRLIWPQTQGYRCALCSIPCLAGESRETDHRIPTSQGGTDEINNKRLVHPWCHRQRHQQDRQTRPRA